MWCVAGRRLVRLYYAMCAMCDVVAVYLYGKNDCVSLSQMRRKGQPISKWIECETPKVNNKNIVHGRKPRIFDGSLFHFYVWLTDWRHDHVFVFLSVSLSLAHSPSLPIFFFFLVAFLYFASQFIIAICISQHAGNGWWFLFYVSSRHFFLSSSSFFFAFDCWKHERILWWSRRTAYKIVQLFIVELNQYLVCDWVNKTVFQIFNNSHN